MAVRSREGRQALKDMRQAWVDRLPKAIESEMRAAVQAEANTVADAMRRIVAVDQGDLRNSIIVEMDENALKATISAGGRKAFYARFVEYGTKAKSAQPFFWPTWRSRKQTVKRRLAAAFRKAFKKHGGAPV